MGLFLQLSYPEIVFRPPVWQRQDRPRLPDLDRGGKAIEEDAPLQGLLFNIAAAPGRQSECHLLRQSVRLIPGR